MGIQSGMRNPIECMFQIIKQPFGELAESAYCAMQNIGKSPWAVHLFVGEPGLLEYILDRDVHMKKEGKEMKYELIRILQLNSVSSDGNVMPPSQVATTLVQTSLAQCSVRSSLNLASCA